MSKLLLTLSAFVLLTQVYAQKIEIAAHANAGLFHYSGDATAATSFFLPGATTNQYRSNNSYGNENGVSYGAGMQAQFISKNGFIMGLLAGYEVLRSKEAINSVIYYNSLAPFTNAGPVPASGQSFLESQDITLNPYIGYRLQAKKIRIDLMPGLDISYNVSAYDKGSAAASDGTVYKADYKLPKAPTDLRLRFGAAAWYNRWGLTASYAHGLTNYSSDLHNADMPTGPSNVHSEVLRFGVSYRIF